MGTFILMEFMTDLKMASKESVNEVFLPDKEGCLKYLREHR
jgi:hypothetical protein